LPGYKAGATPAELLSALRCDLLLEASPVNLHTGEAGQRGLDSRRDHRRAGHRPPAPAYRELHDFGSKFAALNSCLQRHGLRCAAGDQHWAARPGGRPYLGLRGIFNATTNYILRKRRWATATPLRWPKPSAVDFASLTRLWMSKAGMQRTS
jgi:hypothetical protein